MRTRLMASSSMTAANRCSACAATECAPRVGFAGHPITARHGSARIAQGVRSAPAAARPEFTPTLQRCAFRVDCHTGFMNDSRTASFRLHPAELKVLQKEAARHGIVIREGDIRSFEDYHEALFLAMAPDTAADLENFLDSHDGTSAQAGSGAPAVEETPVDELAARRAARRVT